MNPKLIIFTRVLDPQEQAVQNLKDAIEQYNKAVMEVHSHEIVFDIEEDVTGQLTLATAVKDFL